MIVVAAFRLTSHFKLCVAREQIPHEDPPGIALEAPGIVLKCPKIKGVERIRRIFSKHWKSEFCGTILLTEKKSQTVFGIVRAPAKASTDTDARVDLKSFSAIWVNEFHGAGTLPGTTVLTWIRIDSFG